MKISLILILLTLTTLVFAGILPEEWIENLPDEEDITLEDIPDEDIPDEDIEDVAGITSQDNQNMTPEEHLQRMKDQLNFYEWDNILLLRVIKNYNYTDVYPTLNIQDQFPELMIGEDGYPHFITEEVYLNYKYDVESYPDIQIGYKYYDFTLSIYQSNPIFHLIELMKTLADATTLKTFDYDDDLAKRLEFFKFVVKDENNKYTFDTEGYGKFDDEYNTDNIPDYTENEEELHEEEIATARRALLKYTISRDLKIQLQLLKAYNLKQLYPEFDFENQLPELGVNEEGYATFDIDEVINGFHLDTFEDLDYDNELYQSNEQFNLIKILSTLAKMTTFNHIDIDPPLTISLMKYQFFEQEGNGHYVFDGEGYFEANELYEGYTHYLHGIIGNNTGPTKSLSNSENISEQITAPTKSLPNSEIINEPISVPPKSLSDSEINNETITAPTKSLPNSEIVNEPNSIPPKSIPNSENMNEPTSVPPISIPNSENMNEPITAPTKSIPGSENTNEEIPIPPKSLPEVDSKTTITVPSNILNVTAPPAIPTKSAKDIPPEILAESSKDTIMDTPTTKTVPPELLAQAAKDAAEEASISNTINNNYPNAIPPKYLGTA